MASAVSAALDILTSVFTWLSTNVFTSILLGISIIGFVIGIIIQKIKG